MELEPTARDVGAERSAPPRSSSSVGTPNRPWMGLFSLILGVLFAGLFFLRSAPSTSLAFPPEEAQPAQPLFQGWGKPDLAIVISGEMHGYLQPCGCSHPQKGGLARRYNFIQSLKDKKWQILAVDLGDIAQAPGPMTLLKYRTSMKALDLMGYSAIGLGKRELLMPLHDALGEYSLNHDKPRPVALNLANTEKANDVFHSLNARQYEVVASKPKIGVIGLVGHDVAKDVRASLPPTEPDIKFGDNGKLVGPALADMKKQGIDFGVILYQGNEEKALACADSCAKLDKTLPPVRLIVCLADNEAPPGVAVQSPKAPQTHIVSIGHKGIYVGVVGFFRKALGKGYDVKYQLVTIGPEYQTKPGQEKANPVAQLMEDYAKEVKDKNFLAKSPRGAHNPVQVNFKNARYVGSDRCADCHEHAYKVWENKPGQPGHGHAYDTLEKAVNPSLRHHDPECIVCHTVGFKHPGGYNDPPAGANLQKHNVKLRHVGCESCHGPASDHVNNPMDKALYPIINPYRPSAKETDPATPAAQKKQLFEKRMLNLDFFCQKCHDIENDVHWGNFNFIKDKWMKIEHADPAKKKDGARLVPVPMDRRPSAGIDPPPDSVIPEEDGKKDDD